MARYVAEATRTLLSDIDLIVYDMAGTTVQDPRLLVEVLGQRGRILCIAGRRHCVQNPATGHALESSGTREPLLR